EPWRILLLPQPERICLMVRIDALGVHELGLYKLDEALHFVADWLPRGEEAGPGTAVYPDALLASSERSALVTVTRYTTQGSAEIAGASTDVILARHNGRLHVFSRDPADRAALLPTPLDGHGVRETLPLRRGGFPGERGLVQPVGSSPCGGEARTCRFGDGQLAGHGGGDRAAPRG